MTPITLSNLCILSYGNGFTHWHYRNEHSPDTVLDWSLQAEDLGEEKLFQEGDTITITHYVARKTTIHALWKVDGRFQLHTLSTGLQP